MKTPKRAKPLASPSSIDTVRCPQCGQILRPPENTTPDPDTHCVCPGGPVWRFVADTQTGREMRLRDAWRLFGAPVKGVPFWDQDTGRWMVTPIKEWRWWLVENWKEIAGA